MRSVIKCLCNYRKWRQARALDGAIIVLYTELGMYSKAHELMRISDDIWEQILGEKKQ